MGGIISFKHIHINGINPHYEFVELDHVMGVLDKIYAGVYRINVTGWDTIDLNFQRYIKSTIKKR